MIHNFYKKMQYKMFKYKMFKIKMNIKIKIFKKVKIILQKK